MARQYLAMQTQDAAVRMAPRDESTPAEVLSSFDGVGLPSLNENHVLLSGNPAPLDRTASDLAEFMLEQKLLSNAPALKDLTDNHFLPETKR